MCRKSNYKLSWMKVITWILFEILFSALQILLFLFRMLRKNFCIPTHIKQCQTAPKQEMQDPTMHFSQPQQSMFTFSSFHRTPRMQPTSFSALRIIIEALQMEMKQLLIQQNKLSQSNKSEIATYKEDNTLLKSIISSNLSTSDLSTQSGNRSVQNTLKRQD